MIAAVGRFVESAARAVIAAIGRPRRTARGPHAGKDHLRVSRIEHEINRPGIFIFIENLLPGLAAVERAENATLGIRTIRMPERGDKNAVRILGIDEDRSNLLRIAQSAIRCPDAARCGPRRSICRYRRLRKDRAGAGLLRCRHRSCSDSTARQPALRSNRSAGRHWLDHRKSDSRCGRSPSSSKLRRCWAPCRRHSAGRERRKSPPCGRRETGRSCASEVPGTSPGHTAGRKAPKEKGNTEKGEQNPEEALVHGWSSKKR